MSRKKGLFKRLQAGKQDASRVAVLRVPDKPRTPAAYAPILENLATLGAEVDDPKLVNRFNTEFAIKMGHFRTTCTSALEKAIGLHAERFAEGWYGENDPQLKECDRMTTVVTYGVYLTDAVEKLYEKAVELKHTGVFALFDETLKTTRTVLSENFYQLNTVEAIRLFMRLQPQLFAALHAAGLSEIALEPKQAFLATRDEAIKRVEAVMGLMCDLANESE